jgi:hypothetical protein
VSDGEGDERTCLECCGPLLNRRGNVKYCSRHCSQKYSGRIRRLRLQGPRRRVLMEFEPYRLERLPLLAARAAQRLPLFPLMANALEATS